MKKLTKRDIDNAVLQYAEDQDRERQWFFDYLDREPMGMPGEDLNKAVKELPRELVDYIFDWGYSRGHLVASDKKP